ncbi:pre-mRNA-splicing regulator female-lethal(2)D [Rhagoletis pomonella]|uniref:pre-mRNA-splicing regulator female-lethal(2)D n=1 Tax=Rhagoletis pomonella TaxID=28610 RepID=UPI00177AF20F|nr:pre-mRNA-splicing regulator female-lethal(2)D [Rhagoletis pomonella]
MSVAAMTMDDQRPLMNSYDKLSKQYDQNLHGNTGVGSGVGGNGLGVGGAPPSGPASPTPSGSEELQHQYHHSHHHHSHHHHHHHSRHIMHQHAPHMSASEHQPPSPPPTQQQQQLMHHHNQHHQIQQQQQQQLQQQQPGTVAEAVAAAEHRQRLLEDEIESLKLEQARLSQQCVDAQRREKILMRRLANKEQEFQDYVSQIAEYKAQQAPTSLALRSALLDPAVNLLFEKLKKELKATKAKLEETQNELSAWKFTPDSNTGKRLIAKCRLLYQENEELGKMTSNGRLSKLETELAMQKSFCEEVKKSQSEVDDFLPELDEDVEGMQSTILFLQQELKTTRDRIQTLEKENYQLKTGIMDSESIVKSEVTDALNVGDANHPSMHSGLNGAVDPSKLSINAAETCAIPYNIVATSNNTINANSNPTNALTTLHNTHTLTNELKYVAARPLETIDENACVRNYAATNEYYNGNEDQQQKQHVPIPIPAEVDANTSLNSFSAATVPGSMLRTVASRKRNFEFGDPNENQPIALVAAPATPIHVTAPRTLPPKKSKLRRASVQSNDMNEFDTVNVVNAVVSNAPMLSGGNGGLAAIDPLSIVDNAVVGMANEEHPSGMAIDDAAIDGNAGGVALRIMTRRRSVRQQQNGNIGGDSNH